MLAGGGSDGSRSGNDDICTARPIFCLAQATPGCQERMDCKKMSKDVSWEDFPSHRGIRRFVKRPWHSARRPANCVHCPLLVSWVLAT